MSEQGSTMKIQTLQPDKQGVAWHVEKHNDRPTRCIPSDPYQGYTYAGPAHHPALGRFPNWDPREMVGGVKAQMKLYDNGDVVFTAEVWAKSMDDAIEVAEQWWRERMIFPG